MIKNITERIISYIKQLERKKLIIISLAIIGIVLIIFSDFLKNENEIDLGVIDDKELHEEAVTKMKDPFVSDVSEMEELYEESLQAMLNKITGITEVEVMINIDSTNVQLYEKDVVFGSQTTVETDQSGGRRTVEDETKETNLVYVRKGDEEIPVLLKTEKPAVRGVFIIAKGVDNAAVRQMVVEAVSRVLDVPTYRISVLPK
ncbi:MAG TPA: stage III sporulation protein AG [Pseudogracilibacillus sp.]|nr:stage III sporulation protein AG [Pseudogracilibacillus sp.]